jgi:hypothetical protein
MAIRRTTIAISDYYQDMKDSFTVELERARLTYDELASHSLEKRSKLVPDIDKFALPVIDYPEFQQNKYINGRLENAAKGMYEDKRNDLEHKHLCFRLVAYAVDLRKIADLEKKIKLYEKCLAVSKTEYREILNTFYNEVHNKLILEAHGYRLEGKLGFICINRVINTGVQICDFNATNKRRKELESQGIHIWNKAEAEFAKKNGIEYNAVDPKVYKADESWYELALCNCLLPNRRAYKLSMIDYRGVKVRQYTNDELIALCNADKSKICDLPISLKIKLSLCLKTDKMMYSKFIRNEAQTKCGFISYSR